ncbi:MAG: GNAT family N-acetyltransferase [Alphaproteobacteria bacterium]
MGLPCKKLRSDVRCSPLYADRRGWRRVEKPGGHVPEGCFDHAHPALRREEWAMELEQSAESGRSPIDRASGPHASASGQDGSFRRVYWFEREAVLQHLLRLSPDDRNLRFSGGVSDGRLRDYCDSIDWRRDSILGYWVDKELRGIGELRPLGDAWFGDAEVALSVEQPWRNHDIGTELLRRIAIIARNRLIGSLHLVCLPRNGSMIHLVRKLNADLRFDPSEAKATLALATPTQLTLLLELLDEASGFFGAIRQTPEAA